MDKSYKLKMEEKLNNRIVTKEYLINCIAKMNPRISKLAFLYKKNKNDYFYGYGEDYKATMDKLIAYRKPFVDVLMKEYHMSIDDIKAAVETVPEKNKPTKAVIEQIREILTVGWCSLE